MGVEPPRRMVLCTAADPQKRASARGPSATTGTSADGKGERGRMAASPLTSPRRFRSTDHASAGLRAHGRIGASRLPTGRRFPARLSQCLMTAVVPVYRCGAAPAFHRVPSCRSGYSGAPTQRDRQFSLDLSRGQWFFVSRTARSQYLRIAILAPGLDPVSWTSSERWIRCPKWDHTQQDDERDDSSQTSSEPVPSGWCWMRARRSAPSPATWT